MAFKNNLKRLRTKKGLTQSQLADAIGVTRPAVTQWESGWSEPKMGTIERIAEILGVRKMELIEGYAESSNGFVDIPLCGSISAGMPLEMLPISERFPCPLKYVEKYGENNLYYLRIKGNSVNRIFPNGCLALIAKNIVAGTEHDLFAVCINGYDATLKHVVKLENGVQLVPDSYDPTIHALTFDYTLPDTEEVTIMGKVVWATMPFDWEI